MMSSHSRGARRGMPRKASGISSAVPQAISGPASGEQRDDASEFAQAKATGERPVEGEAAIEPQQRRNDHQ